MFQEQHRAVSPLSTDLVKGRHLVRVGTFFAGILYHGPKMELGKLELGAGVLLQ